MKNNKGFSLVELIIVIAIMAILVGVMAPQLIKYIEKTNVSNDVQVCDTVRTAVQTAIMDPSVINDSTYKDVTGGAAGTTWTGVDAMVTAASASSFKNSIYDSIGVPSGSTAKVFLDTQLKSNGALAENINIQMNTTSVLVFIAQTDNSGSKSAYATPNTSGGGSCVYAGPAETFKY